MTEAVSLRPRPSDVVILGHLAFQAILVLLYGGKLGGQLLFFYAVFGILTLAQAVIPVPARPSVGHFAKSIFPVILLYFFYRVVDMQAGVVNFRYHDLMIADFEKGLFGVYPTFALQKIMEVWLNELSYVAYGLGIVLVIAAVFRLYRADTLRLFEGFIFAIVLGGVLCLAVASLFPAEGPGRALSNYHYLIIFGPFFSSTVPALVSIVASDTLSFPAIYLCLVIIAAYYVSDFGGFYAVLSFFAIAGVLWSGIYLRYHYLSDSVAALALASIAVIVSRHFSKAEAHRADGAR